MIRPGLSLLTAVLSLIHHATILADCYDPEGRCNDPCPVVLPCDADSDCPPGYFCPPFCQIFPYCVCGDKDRWICDLDFCSSQCTPIPTPTGPRGYVITDIGALGGVTSNALAVNEKGQVVGEADTSAGVRHAFLWQDGTMIDLWAGRSGWSYAIAINNRSQILVGSHLLWDKGVFQEIPSLIPPSTPTTKAINDLGQVVGSSTGGYFLWDGQSIINLSALLGMNVSDINNVGQFGGSISLGDNQYHAAVWMDERIVDLGTLGGLSSGTTKINDFGQAIGVSERAPGGDHIFYSFFWTGGRMIDLYAEPRGPMGLQIGGARGINNCGELVVGGGYPERPAANTSCLYHPDSGPRDLFHLIPAEANWFLLRANDINDHGDIVGYGLRNAQLGPYVGLTRGFYMTPQFGDLDTNGKVDLRDFARMQNWFTGESPPWEPRCLRGDLDRDNDTDIVDFAALLNVKTGP